MTIHLKINMGFKSSSAAQSNMIKMASKKLQHFGNFNLFDMSDNIRTGYRIVSSVTIYGQRTLKAIFNAITR